MENKFRSSPLALAVLSLLRVGPLHPYGIQRLIKEWGKDEVVNVGNRANLYKTIKRLADAGLISVRLTERDALYPERTVYELTEQGTREGVAWLEEMLSTPRQEFPEFPAALSFTMVLGVEGTLAALEMRAGHLAEELTRIETGLTTYSGTIPRVALIEDEYRRAITAAELNWVRGTIDDLRTGRLTWGDELVETARASLAGPAPSEVVASPPPTTGTNAGTG
jgi:DNA-binding PadR family transcriptional regulator